MGGVRIQYFSTYWSSLPTDTWVKEVATSGYKTELFWTPSPHTKVYCLSTQQKHGKELSDPRSYPVTHNRDYSRDPKGSGVVLYPVHGSQEEQQVVSHSGSQVPKQICSSETLSGGNPSVGHQITTTPGTPYLSGPHRCVSTYSCLCRSPQVPVLLHGGKSLSVLSPSIWVVLGFPGVHQDVDQPNCD